MPDDGRTESVRASSPSEARSPVLSESRKELIAGVDTEATERDLPPRQKPVRKVGFIVNDTI